MHVDLSHCLVFPLAGAVVAARAWEDWLLPLAFMGNMQQTHRPYPRQYWWIHCLGVMGRFVWVFFFFFFFVWLFLFTFIFLLLN